MIKNFLELIVIFFFAFCVLLPVYIRLFKDNLFKEWQEKLQKDELKILTNKGKKDNNVKK